MIAMVVMIATTATTAIVVTIAIAIVVVAIIIAIAIIIIIIKSAPGVFQKCARGVPGTPPEYRFYISIKKRFWN